MKLDVHIRQTHIDRGLRCDAERCIVALAISDALEATFGPLRPGYRRFHVEVDTIGFHEAFIEPTDERGFRTYGEAFCKAQIDERIIHDAQLFDNGWERTLFKPTSFELEIDTERLGVVPLPHLRSESDPA